MLWAISNLTGNNNRVSRALAVRYSAIPLENQSTTSSNSVQSVTTSNSSESVRIVLPLDGEETITCFCRKARRKEPTGDQNATDTKLYLEESVLERKLPDADLKALVDLPAGLDYNEWLASHTLALFEHVNLVYGTISEFCTTSGCADMFGPGNRMYLWFDEKGKKTRVAAPQYIDYVMTFTQKTVSDESIFPTKYANEFPSSFESIARKILRLQFHVIAHLYAAHFREIALLGLHTHLNLTFAHLTALHRRFNLIDEKETDVLRDLEIALRLTDDGQGFGGSNATVNVSMATGSMSEDSNMLNIGIAGRIDGESSSQPICTQPEAINQSNIRCDGVDDKNTPSYFRSGVSHGFLNYNINIQNSTQQNHTQHHHYYHHHPVNTTNVLITTEAANNLLQCNNSNNSSNSTTTTTTA